MHLKLNVSKDPIVLEVSLKATTMGSISTAVIKGSNLFTACVGVHVVWFTDFIDFSELRCMANTAWLSELSAQQGQKKAAT